MAKQGSERARLRSLDRKLVKAAKKIKVLTHLSWSPHLESRFLADLQAGRPTLPAPDRPTIDLRTEREALTALMSALDVQHPVEAFLHRTAAGYRLAAEMLESAGTPLFTARSLELYGGPADRIHPGALTSYEAATHLLDDAAGAPLPEPPPTLSAEDAAAHVRARLAPIFGPLPLPVELDPNMASLAAAGSQRIRLRGNTRYSYLQLEQLIQHEALVHSATKRSGRAQPVLSCLGLSSPRTTADQEGLATLAELLTGAMDLLRLERISLRIIAVSAALEGADFLQVFTLHQDAGQSDLESFRSTARIFRGGDVRGGVVFTKDTVYLKGLMRTHAFFRKALRAGRIELLPRLFSGRLVVSDTLALGQAFDSGLIIPPLHVPPWMVALPCLAATLTWAALDDRLQLDRVTLEEL